VGEQRAFGNARRSTGELNEGGIGGGEVNARNLSVRAAFDEFGKMMPTLFKIKSFGGADAQTGDIIRHARHNENHIQFPGQRPHGGQRPVEGDQHPDVCIFQHEFQFIMRVKRVHVDDDRPRRKNGVVGDEILWAVGQGQADAVAFFNPQLDQRVRHAQRLRAQLRERHFRSVKIRCSLERKLGRREMKKILDGKAGKANRRGNEVVVIFLPGSSLQNDFYSLILCNRIRKNRQKKNFPRLIAAPA